MKRNSNGVLEFDTVEEAELYEKKKQAFLEKLEKDELIDISKLAVSE